MSRNSQSILCALQICLAILLSVNAVWAEDEDLNTSVYLEFDPETGEFVTVQDPASVPKQHGPQDASSTNVTHASTTVSTPDSAPGGRQFPWLAASALILGLLGGVTLWRRNGQRSGRNRPTADR